MCGIAGYIGESKKPVLTYQLITKLFEKSECRGIDAAGYWGTESGKDGDVLYHKEPGKASVFIKKEMWKQVCKHNPNLLLVHARGASKGVGEPTANHNNHPFTSLDKSIGLIHNGRVDDVEYNALKQKYGLNSQCDSEMILRIFEYGDTYTQKELKDAFGDAENPARLAGIRDVFSLINEGHMAVAVGERGTEGERMMWLFRNRHRPLWVVDMREALGQVFFVSEPTIWEEAISECSAIKALAKSQKLIELPTEEIWYFKITPEQTTPKNVQRYEVCREGSTPWQYDGKKHSPARRYAPFKVITQLDDMDRILPHGQKPVQPDIIEWEEFPLNTVNKRCDEIIDLVNNIRTYAEQLVREQSITRHDFDQLLENLEQQRADMEGLSAIISR
jgi:hypothetical protein